MPEVEPNWKGSSPKPRQKRSQARGWRREVLRRSKHRCMVCGLYSGAEGVSGLAAHHVIFKSHCGPEFHSDPRNGVALCHPCHRALHDRRVQLPTWKLRADVIECLAELGLHLDEHGDPYGTLAMYFVGPTKVSRD